MPQNKPLLIIAQSGRALAKSAAKAGITTCVIDRFGDQDTSQSAVNTWVVDGESAKINPEHLCSILKEFNSDAFSGVIVGSGLEDEPEILNWINNRWALIGNSATVTRRCKDPEKFFPLLDSLMILHPEVSYDATVNDKNHWLVKRAGACGGGHIYQSERYSVIKLNEYLQKKINGQTFSAVFLADGKQSLLIGLSEIHALDPEHGNFTYYGATALPHTDKNLYKTIEKITIMLVNSLQLKGLCGIDFIIDRSDKCFLLEVNPRPTATFELHEGKDSLLQVHILACNGNLISEYKKISEYRACRIIYANQELVLPGIDWPDWVTDRPVPGRNIQTGMPICTIHATGKDRKSVMTEIETRIKTVQTFIAQYQIAA